MKFGNWKLEIRNLFIVLLFLLISLFTPSFVSAQSITPTESTSTATVATPSSDNNSHEPSGWEKFWNWLIGLFISDYDIPTDISLQKTNFTDYGNVNDPRNQNINSAENRSTSNNQQLYFKGQYIKDVINDVMTNKAIAKICDQKFYRYDQEIDNCEDFTIKDLAYYFVKDNQSFLYQNQNGLQQNLNQLSNKIPVINTLPEPEFSKYKDIYLNFFRVPPEYDDATKNQNATRVIRTPIPNKYQSDIPTDSSALEQDIKAQQKQLDQNFSPDGTSAGLSGLQPEGW